MTEVDTDQIMQVQWSQRGVFGVACFDHHELRTLCCFAQRVCVCDPYYCNPYYCDP